MLKIFIKDTDKAKQWKKDVKGLNEDTARLLEETGAALSAVAENAEGEIIDEIYAYGQSILKYAKNILEAMDWIVDAIDSLIDSLLDWVNDTLTKTKQRRENVQ